jgi:starch phosphorylase
VHFRVLKADVGRVPVLLLDTDLAVNHPADRPITSLLYVSGREMRFCQEMLLGLGGVKTLKALGISPAVWHMNEGHSALLSAERLRLRLRQHDSDFDAALADIAEEAVFTTHTPVAAGNERFPTDLVRRYLADWAAETSMDLDRVCALGENGDEPGQFNMTVAALRSSKRANGVSRLHGEVAGKMWNHLLAPQNRSVEHVTNGVHVRSWIGPEIGDLLRSELGSLEQQELDDGFTTAVEAIPGKEIWHAHNAQKRRLVGLIRQHALEQFARHGRSPDELRELDHLLDPEVLLIGFARRFATYKRADLILRDIDRFKRLIAGSDRPVQFLFAGKAHPADRPGQDLIRRIWQASLDPDLQGRLLFLENYDMRIARFMVQGVDLWLNTPRRPLEASGTSGMKAAINKISSGRTISMPTRSTARSPNRSSPATTIATSRATRSSGSRG